MKVDPNSPAYPGGIYDRGMTVRTWLAGQALAGLAAKYGCDTPYSATAVEIADLTITELNK